MKILGIETSCDDTAAAVIDESGRVLSNVLSSQNDFHRDYGGIVPEIASRKHAELIGYVIEKALKLSNTTLKEIDLVSVTKGPGLVGSLLIGIEAAKALSFALEKPLVGVNHLEGHIYSLFLEGAPLFLKKDPFPLLVLIVSGGHTQLVMVDKHSKYRVLGKTRDDAAGEAIDKFARHLGYDYPGGPIIEKLGREGDFQFVKFPSLTFKGSPYEFSFSGLKTAGIYYIDKNPDIVKTNLADVVASFEYALVNILVERTLGAAYDLNAKSIGVVGGVSANSRLRETFSARSKLPVYFPPKNLSTDNASMIALAGVYRFATGCSDNLQLDAYSRLELGQD